MAMAVAVPPHQMHQNGVAINGSVSNPSVVRLSLVIERAVQSTYHQLVVLAELLPRKTDVERKIELCKWCVRTRQLFVRLFALTKWVSGSSKVDRSTQMSSFLDQQSAVFIQCADRLSSLSRETLACAKLPNFNMPAAVDVLATGSFPRLPASIREKIVSPDPATEAEKRAAIQKLHHLIPSALAYSDLPKEFSTFAIDSGRVTFTVDSEFSVSLTLFGVDPGLPWRLLDVNVLISDHTVGEGRSLLHQSQKLFLLHTIQQRLNSNQFNLSNVYQFLHGFCQSLRLELLHSQLGCIMLEQRNNSLGVESYTPGSELKVAYWKDCRRAFGRPEKTGGGGGGGSPFSFTISLEEDGGGGFRMTHQPKLSQQFELTGYFGHATGVSMQRIVADTIRLRSVKALEQLAEYLSEHAPGFPARLLRLSTGTGPSLAIQLLHPYEHDEALHVHVHHKTGAFALSQSAGGSQSAAAAAAAACRELELLLNKHSQPSVRTKLEALRKAVLLRRVENCLHGVTCSVMGSLQVAAGACQHGHWYTRRLPETKVFIQLDCSLSHFVVVSIELTGSFPTPRYSLLRTCPGGGEQGRRPSLVTLLPLDVSKCSDPQTETEVLNKRARYSTDPTSSSDQLHFPGLRAVVASCIAKLVGSSLRQSARATLGHDGLVTSWVDGTPVLTITHMPIVNKSEPEEERLLARHVFQTEVQLVRRDGGRGAGLCFVLYTNPVHPTPSSKLHLLKCYFELDKWGSGGGGSSFDGALARFAAQWRMMALLFHEYLHLTQYLADWREAATGGGGERPAFFSILAYDLSKLVLGYGGPPGGGGGAVHAYTLTLYAFLPDRGSGGGGLAPSSKLMSDKLRLGVAPHAAAPTRTNPHATSTMESLVRTAYRTGNVEDLLCLLHALSFSARPLALLNGLPRTPLPVGVSAANRPQDLFLPAFQTCVQSVTSLWLGYRGVFGLDVELRPDGVQLTDAFYSHFTDTKGRCSLKGTEINPQPLMSLHWLCARLRPLAARQSCPPQAPPRDSLLLPAMSPPVHFGGVSGSTPPTMPSGGGGFMETAGMSTPPTSGGVGFGGMPGPFSPPPATVPKFENPKTPRTPLDQSEPESLDQSEPDAAPVRRPNSTAFVTHDEFEQLFNPVAFGGGEVTVLELWLLWNFAAGGLKSWTEVSSGSGFITAYGHSFSINIGLALPKLDGLEFKLTMREEAVSEISRQTLDSLESYFSRVISALPLRQPVVHAWVAFLQLPDPILCDLSSIVRFHLHSPDHHKWRVHILWTAASEPATPATAAGPVHANIGNACVVVNSNSISLVLELVAKTAAAERRRISVPLTYFWQEKRLVPALTSNPGPAFETALSCAIQEACQTFNGPVFLSTVVDHLVSNLHPASLSCC